MLNVTVIQPKCFSVENPDEKISEFILSELEKVPKGGLIVAPEYSNAGGLSDAESEIKAMPRAKTMLDKASEIAKRKCAYVARSSYSMDTDENGGCSMIVAPDGKIIKNMGKDVGSVSCDIAPFDKYMRSAGYGGGLVKNNDFISAGLCPEAF